MFNITIDGPSGAGKSTIGKAVAACLGITYLDTGAMYRAVALFVTRRGAAVDDEKAVEKLLSDIEITYRDRDGASRILLNGEDVSAEIRRHEISALASDVSKLPCVRTFLVAMQRKIARAGSVVLDGRDIGTVVLPDAQFKFFLTADARERARRRCEELKAKGQAVDFDVVLADIERRDKNDSERALAPLKQAPDAVLIDSTNMTPEEVTASIVGAVRGKDAPTNPGLSEGLAKAEEEKKEKRPWTIYRFLVAALFWLLYVIWPTKIFYKERVIHDRRALFICNHYGFYDSNPILGKLFGKRSNIVLKSELCRIKFVANMFREVGGIPIRRETSDMSAFKQVLSALKRDEQVLIYPEGSRNPHDIKEMQAFKDGAATFALKTHAEIVPMMHYRAPKFYRRNYLMVGEPFDLSQFYDRKIHEVKEEATRYIYDKMTELRAEIDFLVEECGGSVKKYEKRKAERNADHRR